MTSKRVSTSAGWQIAYDVEGSGPPLLLICGLLMDRSRWHATGYVRQLSKLFTVVCVDPLGHGDSDKPHDVDAYRAEELVDHVVSVMDAEHLDSARLWGYSRGGLIAALTTWAVPGRVDAVVIGGCPMRAQTKWPPAMVEALAHGEWSTFWEGFPLPGPVRNYMEQGNDPVAIAAAIRGGAAPVEWRRFESPAIAYLGDGEDFVELNRDVAQRIGLSVVITPTGGHAETFSDAERSLEHVVPYL